MIEDERKKAHPKTKSLARQVAECYTEQAQIDSDPFGSWTGKCADEYEIPVQDADDL